MDYKKYGQYISPSALRATPNTRGVSYNAYASYNKAAQHGEHNKYGEYVSAIKQRRAEQERRKAEEAAAQLPKSLISDYSDPMEINSFVDALSNPEGLRARYGDWAAPKAKWWEWLIPGWSQLLMTRMLPGMVAGIVEGVVWDKTLKPMFKGDWAAVGLNTLTNLGETLDIVANPVKGLILGGGEGYLNAMGYNGNGRKNYDYDTGAIPLDIVLEIISDPLNWISFGAKAIGTATVKPVVATTLKAATKEVISETGEAAAKQLSKLAKAGAKANAKGAAKGTFGDIAKRMAHHKVFKFLDTPFSDEMIKALSNVPVDVFQSGSKIANSNLIRAMSSIYKASEGFQSFLVKSVLFSNPVGLSAVAVKKGVIPAISKAHTNHLLKKLKPYKIGELMDITQFEEAYKAVYKESMQTALTVPDANIASGQLLFEQYRNTTMVIRQDLSEVVIKHAGSPEELQKHVTEYIKTKLNKPGVAKINTLQEYIATVNDMNTRLVNGKFDEFEQFLTAVQKQIDDGQKLQQYKAIEQAAHNFDNYIGWFEGEYTRLLQDQDIPRTKKQLKELIAAIRKYDRSLAAEVQAALKQIGNASADTMRALYDDYLPRYIVETLFEREGMAFSLNELVGADATATFRNYFNALPDEVNGIDMRPHKTVIMERLDAPDAIRAEFRDAVQRESDKLANQLIDRQTWEERVLEYSKRYHKKMSTNIKSLNDIYEGPHIRAYTDLYKSIEEEYVNAGKTILNFARDGESVSKIQAIFAKLQDTLDKVNEAKTLKKPVTENLQQLAKELDTDVFKAWSNPDVVPYAGTVASPFEGKVDDLRDAVQKLIDDPTSSKALNDYARAYSAVYNEASVKASIREATSQTLLTASTAEARHYANILESLEFVSPVELTNRQTILTAGEIAYRMKYEQMYSTVRLLTDETRTAFMHDLAGGGRKHSALANFINHIANNTGGDFPEEIIEAAQKLKNVANGYISTREFIDQLYRTTFKDLPKSVTNTVLQNAIFSSLENSEFLEASAFLNATTYKKTFEELFEKIESHINTVQFKQSFSLDFLRGTGQGRMPTAAYNEFLKANPKLNKAHDALSDVAFLDWYFSKEYGKMLTDEFQYVFLDIETTSLNPANLNILELRYGLHGTSYDAWGKNGGFIHNASTPDSGVLNTLFADIPAEERAAAYAAKYGSATLTEADALMNFFQFIINASKQNQKPIKLVAHNGLEFDFPALFTRFEQLRAAAPETSAIRAFYNMPEFQGLRSLYMHDNTTGLIDTLKVMREEAGMFKMTPRHREKVHTLVSAYARKLDSMELQKMFTTYDFETINTLQTIKRDYMDPMLKGNGSPLDAQRIFETENIIQGMYDDLRALKENNALLGNLTFQKSDFYSQSGRFMDFGDYSHMSQILYENADGLYTYGYAKDVIHDLILTYFDFAEGEAIDYVLGRKLTAMARKIDKNIKGIKNIHRLVPFDAEITKTLTSLRSAILESAEVPLAKKLLLGAYMKPDTATGILTKDLTHRYAVLQYLYNEAARYDTGIINTVFRDEGAKALRNILTNPGTLYSPYVKGMQKNFTEYLASELKPLELFTEPELKAMSADFQYAAQGLKDYGDHLDDIGASHAVKFKLQGYQKSADLVNKPYDVMLERLMPTVPFRHKQKYIENIKNFMNAVAVRQTTQILALPDEALKNVLATWGHRVIRLDAMDIFSNSEFNGVLKNFVARKGALAKIGVDVITDANSTVIEIVLNKAVKVDVWQGKWFIDGVETKAYDLRTLAQDYAEYGDILQYYDQQSSKWVKDDRMLAAFNEARKGLNDMNHGSLGNALGDMMRQETLGGIYDNLSDAAKKALPDYSELMHDKFFTMNQFNFSNLGSIKSRRMVQYGLHEDFVQMYLNSAKQSTLYTKDLTQYMDIFLLDNEMSLSNLLNAESLKLAGFADETEAAKFWLKELAENPEYRLAVLVEDKKIGAKLIELKPTSPKQLLKAQELGAVILPYHVYSTAYNVVNKSFMNMYGQNFLNKFSRLIYAYKMGFLLKPGVVIRNFVDGQVKNMIETGDPLGMARDTVEACSILNKYNHIVSDIQMMGNGLFGKEQIDFYFDSMVDASQLMSKDEFFFIHNFITSDVSAGLTGEIAEIYRPKNYSKAWNNPEVFRRSKRYTEEMTELLEQGKPTMSFKDWNKVFEAENIARDASGKILKNSPVKPLTAEEPVWNFFTESMRKIMKPNGYVEQVNRLGLLINKSKNGLDNLTEMYYRIAKVHFDYALKTPAQRMMELLIPFYSFTMKNAHYWAEVASTKPWAMTLMRDIMTPIWNLDEHSPEELERNKTLQNRILRGNIQLFNSEMTFKLNPSFMDPLNMMTDPIGSLRERLVPPISYLDKGIREGNWSRPEQLLPVAGSLAQSARSATKNISETKNPAYAMSSVFGRTYNYSPRKPRLDYHINSTGIRAYLDEKNIVPRYRSNTSSVVPQKRIGTGRSKLRFHYMRAAQNMVPYRIKNFSRYHLYGR